MYILLSFTPLCRSKPFEHKRRIILVALFHPGSPSEELKLSKELSKIMKKYYKIIIKAIHMVCALYSKPSEVIR